MQGNHQKISPNAAVENIAKPVSDVFSNTFDVQGFLIKVSIIAAKNIKCELFENRPRGTFTRFSIEA